MLREYAVGGGRRHLAARLPAPMTVTPLSVTTVAPARLSRDVAAGRPGGEVDDHRAGPHAP